MPSHPESSDYPVSPLRPASILAVFLLGMISAFGQGTVNFNNAVSFVTPADRLVRDVGGDPLVGPNYFAQLYYGPLGATEDNLIAVTSAPATFREPGTTLPGTWRGGVRFLTGTSALQTVVLQVRVWDGDSGASWEDALAIGFGGKHYGASIPFTYVIPLPDDTSPAANHMDNFRGFALVPEPSPIAISLMSVFALSLIQRRSTWTS